MIIWGVAIFKSSILLYTALVDCVEKVHKIMWHRINRLGVRGQRSYIRGQSAKQWVIGQRSTIGAQSTKCYIILYKE